MDFKRGRAQKLRFDGHAPLPENNLDYTEDRLKTRFPMVSTPKWLEVMDLHPPKTMTILGYKYVVEYVSKYG